VKNSVIINTFRDGQKASVVVMKSETHAQKYRREAEECNLNAQSAMRTVDREAWLRLAADWMKLAESAELNPLLERLRH
jgi:hypothetical protein